MNKKYFSNEEILLFEMIAESLCCVHKARNHEVSVDYDELIRQASHQAVLPMIADAVKKYPLSQDQRKDVEHTVRDAAMEFYQIFLLARKTVQILEQGGIKVALLKGASVARYYPIPESRKSSDIDLLLLDKNQLKHAGELLKDAGYRHADEQIANHHQVWGTPDNHMLELHLMLVEPFDNQRLNQFIQRLYSAEHVLVVREKVLGVELPMLGDHLLAFHLLLHMLQDFLRSGFGLKLLCDWVVFWNRPLDQEVFQLFFDCVKEAKLTGFYEMITSVCVRYLGLEDQKELCPELVPEELCADFMRDILEAERTGKPSPDRMVSLRSQNIFAYMRELHHQTVLSFPTAGRFILSLPVLYLIVLVRFLYNNRVVRNQSTRSILKEAGRRSRFIQEMELYKR